MLVPPQFRKSNSGCSQNCVPTWIYHYVYMQCGDGGARAMKIQTEPLISSVSLNRPYIFRRGYKIKMEFRIGSIAFWEFIFIDFENFLSFFCLVGDMSVCLIALNVCGWFCSLYGDAHEGYAYVRWGKREKNLYILWLQPEFLRNWKRKRKDMIRSICFVWL